jgi:hypothetical protein
MQREKASRALSLARLPVRERVPGARLMGIVVIFAMCEAAFCFLRDVF